MRKINSKLFCTIPFTRKIFQKNLNQIELKKLYFQYSTTLNTLEKIFQTLKEQNKEIEIINNKENELLISTGIKGNFHFRIDPMTEQLVVITPYSGILSYYYCNEDGLWLGIHDKHDLRGLITRDWLRGYIGCPSF